MGTNDAIRITNSKLNTISDTDVGIRITDNKPNTKKVKIMLLDSHTVN